MKRIAETARPGLGPAPTPAYVVRFEQRPRRAPRREQPSAVGGVLRVARLLALAHRIDGLIHSGELRDWADAARLAGVTRARMTQIANLLLLAPGIQELLLSSNIQADRNNTITERSLRDLLPCASWAAQQDGLRNLMLKQ